MADSVEREKQPEQPVEFKPEQIEVRPDIERETGIKAVPSQFTKKVTDDKGQVLMQSPATQTVTITLPTDKQTLTTKSKGSSTDSSTWFAGFWLRLIKKALHFG